eukprot:g4319.t1
MPKPLHRNLSPLELFRMTLEVDQSGGSAPEESPCTPHDGEGEIGRDSIDANQSSIYTDGDSCRSQSSYIDRSLEIHNSATHFTPRDVVIHDARSESKRSSKFPFKQCSKMMTSARKTFRLADMSLIPKERFFKNPQYSTNCISCSSVSPTLTPRRTRSIESKLPDEGVVSTNPSTHGTSLKVEDPKRQPSHNGLLKKLMMMTESQTETSSESIPSSHKDSRFMSSSSTSPGRNGCTLKTEGQKRRSQGGSKMVKQQGLRKKEQKKTGGVQSSRTSEERSVHMQQGFTAFVPFQGFDAFSNQGNSHRTSSVSTRS